MTEWIRACDSAPDINTPVLVTFDNGKERIAQSVAILDEFGDWRWWQYEEDDFRANPKVADCIDVVAWMPLPAPFGGDECGEERVEAIMTFIHLTLPTLIPIGESNHDQRVEKNIKRLGEVVYSLTDKLCQLQKDYSGSMWLSERQCAETAQEYINDIKELFEEA